MGNCLTSPPPSGCLPALLLIITQARSLRMLLLASRSNTPSRVPRLIDGFRKSVLPPNHSAGPALLCLALLVWMAYCLRFLYSSPLQPISQTLLDQESKSFTLGSTRRLCSYRTLPSRPLLFLRNTTAVAARLTGHHSIHACATGTFYLLSRCPVYIFHSSSFRLSPHPPSTPSSLASSSSALEVCVSGLPDCDASALVWRSSPLSLTIASFAVSPLPSVLVGCFTALCWPKIYHRRC